MTRGPVLPAQQAEVVAGLVKHLEQQVARLDGLCRSLAEAVIGDLQTGRLTKRTTSSSALFAGVEGATAQPELPVLGMGFARALRPGAGGQELHWWYGRGPGRPPQRLLVGARAGHVSDYEISRSHWWQQAAQSAGTCFVGPYVDVSGTNEYVVTASRAVWADGGLAGVVAVDVRVGSFQSSCQPLLLELPRPASVVNPDGDVLATNSGELLGGTLTDPDPGASRFRLPVSGTDWTVVVG